MGKVIGAFCWHQKFVAKAIIFLFSDLRENFQNLESGGRKKNKNKNSKIEESKKKKKKKGA